MKNNKKFKRDPITRITNEEILKFAVQLDIRILVTGKPDPKSFSYIILRF